MDLIERQKAIDALADMHCKSDEDGYVWIIRSDAWARIDALPTIEQPTTEWLGNHTPFRCKRCGHYSDTRTPYCAYCGRKMVE